MKGWGRNLLFILIFSVLAGQIFLWGGCAKQESRVITTGISPIDIPIDLKTLYPFLSLEGLDPTERFQKINDHFAYGCEENLRLINYVQKHHVVGDRGDVLSRLKDAMFHILEEGRLPTPYFKENSENETVKTITTITIEGGKEIEIKPPVLVKYVYFTLIRKAYNLLFSHL